jgi:Transposase zinc-binding domain
VARPALEVADIFRDHGPTWRRANQGRLSHVQMKVMSAIEGCRTAALGGHVARCANPACGHTAIAYNSCGNRHCPKCHVWTAPAMQEESDVPRCGRVRSCIRPIVAATLAAGHDVIRGSGPNQGAALINRMALHGFSRSNGSTVSHQRRHHPLQILDASLTSPILYFFIDEPLTFNFPLRETVRLSDVHGRSPSWSAPPRRCAPSY